MKKMNRHKLAEQAADAVAKTEAEMKRIGYWQQEPLRPEQLEFQEAFGMDTMSYAQWLQFIFLPRVHEAVTSGQFPRSSSVGAQAVREFDGDTNASGLVTLLCDFDALFS